MILNGKTVCFILICIFFAGYIGLQLIRNFAYNIAVENIEANSAMDSEQDKERRRRDEAETVELAAASAFAKVEPLLPSSVKENKVKIASSEPMMESV